MTFKFFRFSFILVLAFPIVCSSQQKMEKITGTYSNLQYITEAGDLLGYEMRIFYTADGVTALVQVSQGGPGVVTLEHPQINNRSVSIKFFNHPYGLVSFEGEIDKKGCLKGKFEFDEGGSESEALCRRKSYWD